MAHPEPDQVIGRLIGARLRGTAAGRAGAAAAEAHPDAETWAAYVDGGLLADEVSRLDAHLAACASCRRLVAGLASEVSVGTTIAAPAAVLPAERTGVVLPFRRPQVVVWMGLAAGLFGAVTLWSVSRLGAPQPQTSMVDASPAAGSSAPVGAAPAESVLRQPAVPPPPAAAAPTVASRELAAREQDALTADALRKRVTTGAAAMPADSATAGVAPAGALPAGQRFEEVKPEAAAAEKAAAPQFSARQVPAQSNAVAAGGGRPHGPLNQQAQNQQALAQQNAINAPAPVQATPLPPPAAPAPSPTVAAPAPAPAPADVPKLADADRRERRANEVSQLSEAVTTTGVPTARRGAARPQAAAAPGADREAQTRSKDDGAAGLALGAVAVAAMPSFAEPEGRLRWRIADGRRLESSSDGGTTWNLRHAATRDRLRAGTAPSIDSAWAVGERGLVLRLAVPGGWTAVTRPAAVTLIGVSATDAQHARVTAADGRIFETADGGATWTATSGAGPQ